MKISPAFLLLWISFASFLALTVEGTFISHARLINADTDEVIPTYDPIANSVEVDLADLPTRNVNIEAVLSDGSSAGSVRFQYVGSDLQIVDNTAPYALGGETGGDFEPMELTKGNYSIDVVAFQEANAGGVAGIRRRVIFTVIDSDLPVPTPVEEERLYLEYDGLVVMEAENTASDYDRWVGENALVGSMGPGYLRFDGNTPTNGPATSPLVYKFRIQRSGLYHLHLHCARETVDGRTDLANDCYVRVEGDYTAGAPPYASHGDNASLEALRRNTKFFGGADLTFVWASGNRLDLGGETNKRVALYDFQAGQDYTLVVSGRSQLFRLDRIVFRHTEVGEALVQSMSLAESTFLTDGAGQWAGYDIESGKFVNTGDWLGYLSIEYAPFVYSFELSSWLYVEADWLAATGFWSYIFK